MRFAIIYLSVPLIAEDDEAAPTEADAEAIGELVRRVVSNTPMVGVELIGTRLMRNNLVAPSINRIEAMDA